MLPCHGAAMYREQIFTGSLTRSTGDAAAVTTAALSACHKCCCLLQLPFPLPPGITGKNLVGAGVPHRAYLLPAELSRWQTPLVQWSLRGEGTPWPYLWWKLPTDLTSAPCYNCWAAFSPDPPSSTSPRLLKGAAHAQTHAHYYIKALGFLVSPLQSLQECY